MGNVCSGFGVSPVCTFSKQAAQNDPYTQEAHFGVAYFVPLWLLSLPLNIFYKIHGLITDLVYINAKRTWLLVLRSWYSFDSSQGPCSGGILFPSL